MILSLQIPSVIASEITPEAFKLADARQQFRNSLFVSAPKGWNHLEEPIVQAPTVVFKKILP